MTEPIRVGILGASGYGGAELIRRLARHPQVELCALGSRQYLGQAVEACWPQLAGVLPGFSFQDQDAVIAACEVLFTATPHGATAPLVQQALEAGKRVVDLSADFRLDPAVYAQWYHQAHPHPELYQQARYGLPEFHRAEITGATLVASPGCNATAVILALAPLAAHGLLGPEIVANVAAGVSGAGRGASLGLHYSEVNENIRPYKVAGTHRHIAEIEASLGRALSSGKEHRTHAAYEAPTITFCPHLTPVTRGILASCYTRPQASARRLDEAELLALYREFYRAEPLVVVQDALPESKAVAGSDRCILSARVDARSAHITVFSVIDNLGKGAAGQAVQNFNVMHGFDETLGLQIQGVWP